jgi:hypothetical protein
MPLITHYVGDRTDDLLLLIWFGNQVEFRLWASEIQLKSRRSMLFVDRNNSQGLSWRLVLRHLRVDT